jgi:hypothetical protein
MLSSNQKLRVGFAEYSVYCDVLYGRESPSFKLKDKHRLMMFENRVLRKTFGHKMEHVTGNWRKTGNEVT